VRSEHGLAPLFVLLLHNPLLQLQRHPQRYRDKIQQEYGLPIEAWEAKSGKKLENGLYRGTHIASCGCAVGEQGEEVHVQPITGTSAGPLDSLDIEPIEIVKFLVCPSHKF